MVLLLTGAIDIRNFNIPSTKITDCKERLDQYLDSIDYALTHYQSISDLVFCENTNFNFDYSYLHEKAVQYGKKLEILSFKGDYIRIQQNGKGYGEGEIIAYALNNSKLLSKSESFFKLTGRLVVKNMDQIITSSPLSSYFIYHPKNIYKVSKDHIETFFYKSEKKLYLNLLMNAYKEVDELRFQYLEHIFYERLYPIKLKSFKLRPEISGLSGTAGDNYGSGNKNKMLEIIFHSIGVNHLTKTRYQNLLTKFLSLLLKIIRWVK